MNSRIIKEQNSVSSSNIINHSYSASEESEVIQFSHCWNTVQIRCHVWWTLACIDVQLLKKNPPLSLKCWMHVEVWRWWQSADKLTSFTARAMWTKDW